MRSSRRAAAAVAAALALPAAATGAGVLIGRERTAAAALLLLLAATGASWFGRAAGIAASLVSFLSLNAMFTRPHGTLAVAHVDDVVALVVFLGSSLAASAFVSHMRAQRLRAERREHEATSLLAVSQRLASGGTDGALDDVVATVRRLFRLRRCELWLADGDGERLAAFEGDAVGEGGLAIPLVPPAGRLVLVPGDRPIGDAERRSAALFARQVGGAVDQARLRAVAREADVTSESNRLREALLSAVSHDFRTPLSTIKAALTAIRDEPHAPIAEDGRAELVAGALAETARLERLVANLLDLARIRSGALVPDLAKVPVEEILEDAIAAAGGLPAHRLTVSVRPGLPPLDADPVQLAQVVRNLLENAARCASRGSEIAVTAYPWRAFVEMRVADRGPGIAPAEREAVFGEFVRGGDSRRGGGAGLGLAIARAIVRAHGGEVWIEETPGGGATVVLRVPAARTA